jgi:seryl-tRNA synthetase
MHDLKTIRDDPAAFDAGLRRRGLPAQSADILALDTKRRAAQTRLQEFQQRRNDVSRQVGAAKSKGQDAAALMAEVGQLKAAMEAATAEEQAAAAALDELLSGIPNLPAADVPDGADADANVELRRHGSPRNVPFAPKQHFEIGETLGLMDFEAAAKLSGARFVVLKGALARLERALAAFMLDLHTNEFGYQEVLPPFLVKDQTAYGTGNLPKFGEDLFRTREGY